MRFVPPLLRRRCGDGARAMLHVAERCCPEPLRSRVSCVFGSRQGPIGTTTELLDQVTGSGPVSPALFTHSVHNTHLGLYSLWTHARGAGSSVAAGAETFATAFLEAACALHRSPGFPALLVVGDERYPPRLDAAAGHAHGTYAVALLLERAEGSAVGEILHFACQETAEEPTAGDLPDALAFVRFWLAGERTLRLVHDQRAWLWMRRSEPEQLDEERDPPLSGPQPDATKEQRRESIR